MEAAVIRGSGVPETTPAWLAYARVSGIQPRRVGLFFSSYCLNSQPQAALTSISRRSSLILPIARAKPGLRRSKRILLTPEPTDEAAPLHPNERFSAQAYHDRPDIQPMHFGEFPRPEPVIGVVPGAEVPSAQRNGGEIR